ncbi:DUF4810 domain-containing protein [Campylobacter sp. FMV-PI01]|uniref:DUF4810 domain-containing protein n=1 Tax=Campylobacter portucalensis TaxID=2608384 RepID=A0A6L5WHU9_9BACT|nr:DUF4810 domain-containing protein [Campylobacter portucalensis]MSN96689.1 DUF4810 domain-containing protein [Campylobacter portucalensis]
MIRFVFFAFFVLLFTGCATKQESVYHWEASYSKSIYDYLNQEGDINSQILNLENLIKNADKNGKKVPPGVNAHLGLLYSNLGNSSKSIYYLNQEAKLFPESKAYIEFLKSQNKRIKNEK